MILDLNVSGNLDDLEDEVETDSDFQEELDFLLSPCKEMSQNNHRQRDVIPENNHHQEGCDISE